MSALEIRVEPSAMGFDPQRLERIQSHFDTYVESRRLAGWLATVSRGGELVWTGRAGHRDRERDLEVTDDTIWRIYSMTKPLTSIGVMMLYEQGLFDLNDDVGQWIEELREPRVYVGGGPESPETIPATEPVRVHHLLSHMSGLTYGFHYLHPVDAIYRSKGYDFGWPKGADLAQAVHDWWCPEEKQDRLAMLYVPSQGESFPFEELARGATHPPSMYGGGGGLVSTAHDYQRFMTMLLRGGELDGARLVSARTLELMTENHLPGDEDLEAFATDSFSEVDYAGVGFGLGFSVVTDRRKNKSLVSEGTFGWGGAASTAFWVDPAEDLTVSFFTQLLPSGTYSIRRELAQLVYQSLVD